MSFKRTIEDFVCEHCGAQVTGSGYTNHCPKCLWSKHVDIHPGDRAATCGGMMEPVRVEGSTAKGYRIVHVCEKCGYSKINDVALEDDVDQVLSLAKGR